MTGRATRERRMPLAAHLREARTRLVWSAAAVALGIIVGYLLAEPVLALLRQPIVDLAESRVASLNYDSLTGAFDLRLKIALILGIVLSAPVWLTQLVAYLVPALTRRERAYLLGFSPVALVLFAAGCAAGITMLPHMVELLASFAADEDSTLLQASTYVDFVLKIVLATGVACTLPLVLVAANFAGLLSARAIARGWRVWVIGIVVFAAMVTPAADVLSMLLIAVPMLALFGAACLVTALRDRAVARRSARPDAASDAPVESADAAPHAEVR